MKIEKLAGALFGVFVTVLAPFTAAQATSINITYSGSAIFNNASVGYETGRIAPNPNSETNRAYVYIGGDSVKTTATNLSIGGVFNAWCVDIYHWLLGSATYNVETGAKLAADLEPLRGNGVSRVDQLIQLADDVYSSLSTKEDNAAFQLAVWEITYGTADSSGHYKITDTDPGFNVDTGTKNSAFANKANGWLDNLGNTANPGHYELTYLNDGTGKKTQDLVVFTAQTFTTFSSVPVPEPSSLALLCLAGLGIISRQKSAKCLNQMKF